MALSTKSASIMAVVALLIISFCAILPGSDGSDDSAASDTYPEGSVTITTNDSQGTITQTYTEIPDRIIVGNVTCLEMLLYFGLGDRIVGIYYLEDEVWSELQDEFQEVVDRLDPEYVCTGLMTQAVATSLQPDLIVGYKSSFGDSNWSIGSTEFWNDQGCNVWSLNSQAGETNVEGMKQDYRDLGEIFQIQDLTDKYISDFDQASSGMISGEPVDAAIFEYSKDETSYTSYGDSSFIGDVLTQCNGNNVFGSVSKVNKDILISSMQLQAIIIVAFGDYTPEQAVSDLLNDPTLQNLPAVKNGNVIAIGLSQTYGGVQALSVMQEIADLLNDAAVSDSGQDQSGSGDDGILYAAVVVAIILIVCVAAYAVRSRSRSR